MKDVTGLLDGVIHLRLIFMYAEGAAPRLERFAAQEDTPLLAEQRMREHASMERRAVLPEVKQAKNGRGDVSGIASVLHEHGYALISVTDKRESRTDGRIVHESSFYFIRDAETSWRNESLRLEELEALSEGMCWRYQFRRTEGSRSARIYLSKPVRS